MNVFTTRRALLIAGVAAIASAATPDCAQAQRDSARAETQFEFEVGRLARELMRNRRTSISLAQTMQSLRLTLRNENVQQLQRAQAQSRLEGLRAQFVAMEAVGARLRNQLKNLCGADRAPDGWVGVAFTADVVASNEDGRIVLRFLDYPVVESVEPGSPADKAGLQAGDRILSMAGQELRDRSIVFSSLLKSGTRIPFRLKRGVESKALTVTVENRPDGFETPCPWTDETIAAAFAPPPTISIVTVPDAPEPPTPVAPRSARPPRAPGPVDVPPPPVPPTPALAPFGAYFSPTTITFAGAQLTAMGPELADAMGVRHGLLVIGTSRGSPAERSGLRGGDVLISVEGRTLDSPAVFRQAIEEAAERRLSVQLVRKKKTMPAVVEW